jgi:hypothetical protein
MASDDVVAISLPLVPESTVVSSNSTGDDGGRLSALDVTHLQTENTLNDTSMNKSSAATVKKIEKIMFVSTERNIFSSSVNKS